MSDPKLTRRPIKARDTKWASSIARWLAQVGLHPNTISLLSVVFAGLAGGCLALTSVSPTLWKIILFVAAAACIQLRLLCNLFDGMVAVEGGLKSKSGEIYNELPDRIADTLVLVGAGYAFPAQEWSSHVGWAAFRTCRSAFILRIIPATSTPWFCGPTCYRSLGHKPARTQRGLTGPRADCGPISRRGFSTPT